MAKETVRDAKPMDPAKAKAIRMKQFESNAVDPDVIWPKITSGKIQGGGAGTSTSKGSGKES